MAITIFHQRLSNYADEDEEKEGEKAYFTYRIINDLLDQNMFGLVNTEMLEPI